MVMAVAFLWVAVGQVAAVQVVGAVVAVVLAAAGLLVIGNSGDW